MKFPTSSITTAEKTNNSATSALQSIDLFSKKLNTFMCFNASDAKSVNISCNLDTIALKMRNFAIYISFVSKVNMRLNIGKDSSSLVSINVSENATSGDVNLKQGFRGSIFIPITGLSLSRVSLYVNVYRTPVLFVDEGRFNSSDTHNFQSYILAVSIDEKEMFNLSQPIVITFKKVYMTNEESKCVFWRFRKGWIYFFLFCIFVVVLFCCFYT